MFGIWGGPKQRALILTEDGRIQESRLRVERGFLVDHRFRQAWGLMPTASTSLRGTMKSFQILYERGLAPYSPAAGKWLAYGEKSVSEIAAECLAETLASLPKVGSRDKLAEAVKLVILVFALLIGLVVVAGLLGGGQLKWPG